MGSFIFRFIQGKRVTFVCSGYTPDCLMTKIAVLLVQCRPESSLPTTVLEPGDEK